MTEVITDVPARYKQLRGGGFGVSVDSREDLTGRLIQVVVRSGSHVGQVRIVRLTRQVFPYNEARGFAAVYEQEPVPRRERERLGIASEGAGESAVAPPITGLPPGLGSEPSSA